MSQGHLQVTAIANPKASGLKIYSSRWTAARGRHWKMERETSADDAYKWLKIFRADEPGVDFVVSRRAPRSVKVTGEENPTFGKRKTGKPKGAKPAKKAAKKFGRKKVAGRTNPKLPTLKDLKLEAAALGMSVTKSKDGEFRVAFKNNREASAYYTDDASDALDTMRAMYRDKKSATVTGNKNPTRSNIAPKKWLVRATTESGKVYYFTGFSLTSFKRDAARYADATHAQKTMEHVEDAMSNGLKRAKVKHLDVIQA